MPTRKMHRNVSQLLLGESGDDIHKFMDAPVKRLGRNHRNERHDLQTVSFLFATEGKKAAQHALGHILLDKSEKLSNKKAQQLVNNDMKSTLNKIKEIQRLRV